MNTNIDIEEVRKYYIDENHTREETARRFGINTVALHFLLKENGIRKVKKSSEYHTYISREDLYSYYIEENHTLADTMKRFNFGEDALLSLMREYGIYKNTKETLESALNRINRDDFYNYYVVENHTARETREKFNIGHQRLFQLINEFNIRKFEEFDVDAFISKHGYEEIYSYYVICGNSRDDTAKHFGITTRQLRRVTERLGIYKEKRHEPLEIILKRVSPDDVYEYYNVQNHSMEETCEHFGIARDALYKMYRLKEIPGKSGRSSYESQFVSELGVDSEYTLHNRGCLQNSQEIDILFKNEKVGVEINGSYWHCDLYKDKKYHQNKVINASKNGIRLIHIFEWEWNNPVKRKIVLSIVRCALGKIKNKIYARNCKIKKISNGVARVFLEENHLHGHRNASVTYGLYNNDRLVFVMSFSRSKHSNSCGEDDWEIIRECPLIDTVVVGGASKVLKEFRKEYLPKSMFSYCDFNKFNGSGYSALGMKCIGMTVPDLWWLMPNGDVYPRSPHKNKEMQEKSLSSIHGAGNLRFFMEFQ